MPESDRELIEGCLAGDKRAWDLFVGRFSNLIYWSIQKTLEKSPFGLKKDVHDDVFQEIFRRILENKELEKLRETRHLRQFLVVMATHGALDKIRSLRRVESRDVSLEKEYQDSSLDPSARVISDERDLAISEILERLSPKERTCVEWHYMDGKAHQDIAAILGMPVGTVSSIIQRTKEKLQTSFQRKGLI